MTWRYPHILLVEDNLLNQEVALSMLERLGCRLSVMENGQLAVDYTRESVFGLILMDCHMPEMDGMVATRVIRSREATSRHVPIIALTADVQKGVQHQWRDAGMDGYLRKPFDRDMSQAKLQTELS